MNSVYKVRDIVYVIHWKKKYSDINRTNEAGENYFGIKTNLPNYCSTEFFIRCVYEPNYTLKGTINKREPRKLVDKIHEYENFKWEILEILKHPKAGKYIYDEEYRRRNSSFNDKYTDENLLLLASTHAEDPLRKCYILIEQAGVSKLTPEQYKDSEFNALVESNLCKWDRETIVKSEIPKELLSVFYDDNDNVLFGSVMIKGLVSYTYLDGKYSTDGKPIYIGSSVLYDGYGNEKCPNKDLIKPFDYIKNFIDG